MAMMTWMRRTSRYFLAAVVITFIASLAYFGATQDRGGADWVVSVNGDKVSAVAYQSAYRALEEQYRQAFRGRFTEEVARSLKLQNQLIERLVTERLVRQRAAQEGLTVSDEELTREITRMGAFQEGGRFSRERYLRLLASVQPPLTPALFEEDLRGELLRQKLQALIADGVKVSDAEVRQQWEIEGQRVRVAYLLASPEPIGEGGAVGDAELEAYYKAHPAEFARPERRRVLVVLLPSSSVPLPSVSDAEVEAAYKERRAQFEQPARARAAHILVRMPSVGGSAAEDAARAKAEAALQRVRGGADFAQVAREVSEDQATASRGGDLGLLTAGEILPELEKLIFSLKPGEVGGPVRTVLGYQVLKVAELLPASKKELKEVAPTLRATLAVEGQLRALRDKARETRSALLGAPDFAAEARRRGLTVREIGPLARTDAVEGIGRVEEATDAIFALADAGVSEAIKTPEGYAIFKLLDHQPSRLPPLAEVKGDVSRAVQRQKAQEAAKDKAQRLVEALRKGEDPRALAKREGVMAGELGPFSRAEPLPDGELGQVVGTAALELPAGGVGGPTPGQRGFYVVKTLARERPDPAEFEKTRAAFRERLLREKRGRLWQTWLAALRAPAKVEINRKLLPES